MQVNSILSGLPDALMLGKRAEPVESPQDDARGVTAIQTGASADGNSAAAKILADYDVTDITPEEFSEMIDRLGRAGLLSDQEFRQLAKVRLDLERADIESDDSIDLVEFYGGILGTMEREFASLDPMAAAKSNRQSSLDTTRERFTWIEKFALIQSAPDALGLDSLA